MRVTTGIGSLRSRLLNVSALIFDGRIPTAMLESSVTGSAMALLCNLICVLPGEAGIIPLNAVTPILGAPVIIYVIINQRKLFS